MYHVSSESAPLYWLDCAYTQENDTLRIDYSKAYRILDVRMPDLGPGPQQQGHEIQDRRDYRDQKFHRSMVMNIIIIVASHEWERI